MITNAITNATTKQISVSIQRITISNLESMSNTNVHMEFHFN
jgi:hypothetical protein